MQQIDNYLLEGQDKDYMPYIEMAKAMSQISHHIVYLFSVKQHRFIYFPVHELGKLGIKDDEIYGENFEYLPNFISAEDTKILEHGFRSLKQCYSQINLEDRERFVIMFNFKLEINNISYKLYHKLSPLAFNKDGMPELALGKVSLSTFKQSGGIYAGIIGTKRFFSFLPQDMYWKSFEPVRLSNREKEMLRLSMLGYTLNDIAKEMNLTPEAIKKHRQQVNDKFGVKNIAEAVAYTIGCYIESSGIIY